MQNFSWFPRSGRHDFRRDRGLTRRYERPLEGRAPAERGVATNRGERKVKGMKRQAARSSEKRAWPDPVRRALAGEGGFVLVSALLAVAVLLVLTLSVSSLASGESRAAPFWRDRTEAFYVAESGLNHAWWKLEYDRASDALVNHQGVFPSDPPTFTSTSEPESKTIVNGQEVSIAMPDGSFYEVWVKIDAVDTAKAAVTIRGKVGDQSYLLKATVHQKKTPFKDPDGDDGTGHQDPDTILRVPPDTDGYDHIITHGNEVAVYPGGTYVVDTVETYGTSTLKFTGDAEIWIIGEGKTSLKASGDTIINPLGAQEGIPEDQRVTVIFYVVSPQTVDLSGDAQVNAFIYAPKIKTTGNPVIYGALVGGEVKVAGSVTFDQQGEDIGFPVTAITEWELISWGQ